MYIDVQHFNEWGRGELYCCYLYVFNQDVSANNITINLNAIIINIPEQARNKKISVQIDKSNQCICLSTDQMFLKHIKANEIFNLCGAKCSLSVAVT